MFQKAKYIIKAAHILPTSYSNLTELAQHEKPQPKLFQAAILTLLDYLTSTDSTLSRLGQPWTQILSHRTIFKKSRSNEDTSAMLNANKIANIFSSHNARLKYNQLPWQCYGNQNPIITKTIPRIQNPKPYSASTNSLKDRGNTFSKNKEFTFNGEKIAWMIRWLNAGNRSRCHSVNTRTTKLHNLVAWHWIILYWCITTSLNWLAQLSIRIHGSTWCSRNSIQLKVLLTHVRVVKPLYKATWSED